MLVFAPFVLYNRNCSWLLVCCGLLVDYYCCCIFLRVWSLLVVETLKGVFLHSIGVMIVYVFVLHLPHTCLFNFFYTCGGNAMLHGGVWKPSRQSLFLFVGYWSFWIVVDLLL